MPRLRTIAVLLALALVGCSKLKPPGGNPPDNSQPVARDNSKGNPIDNLLPRVTAEELARRRGTINYEVTCAIGPRVPRVFT